MSQRYCCSCSLKVQYISEENEFLSFGHVASLQVSMTNYDLVYQYAAD